MLELGKRYTSPVSGSWVQVTERKGDVMRFERSFAPGTGRARPHLHEDLTQTWEALSGEGMIEVAGDARELRKGDRVVIEPGTPHRDPWNPSVEPLHVRGTFDPVNDFIEAYAAAYAQHLIEAPHGRLTKQEEMPLLQILVIAKEFNGRSYGGFPPVAVQRATLPLLAVAGRMWGYQPSYE
jgi:mannose-6-phosphate isomerase-like protein (cupin superfamily)